MSFVVEGRAAFLAGAVAIFILSGVPSAWAASAQSRPSTHWLMRATPLATAVHVLDSGRAGPVALIVGGIHGDEAAGMEAARKLAAGMPERGKLIVIPAANRLAAESDVRTPYYMRDLNRSFPGGTKGNDTERLAAAIMGVVARYRPAIVIDLHEAGSDADPGGSEVENTLILSEEGRAAEIALTVLETVNPAREGRPFSFLAGAPAGSLNREVSRRFRIPVITVETSRRDPLPHRVETQIGMVQQILAALEGGGR